MSDTILCRVVGLQFGLQIKSAMRQRAARDARSAELSRRPRRHVIHEDQRREKGRQHDPGQPIEAARGDATLQERGANVAWNRVMPISTARSSRPKTVGAISLGSHQWGLAAVFSSLGDWLLCFQVD